MHFTHLFGALALGAPLVAGHTLMTTLFIDGENQGDGVCVRQPSDPAKATYPIEPLSNDAMACGYNGETSVSRICPASNNSTLTFLFREWPDASQPGSIDSGHKGPCAVYMKPVADASASDNAASGSGWFKIYEHTYDESTSEWCTDKLIANNGYLSADIPAGLKGGDYLVRTELLALHAATESPPDPQFYVSCAQVFVEGSEDGTVPEGIAIDGSTYSTDIKGLTYNIYTTPLELPYPSFGPDVYQPSSSAKTSSSSGVQAKQSKGLQPEGCILVRDNWCGKEVPSYSDEEGCWASSKQCWSQADGCWDGAPPTGGQNCQIWSDKCTNIDDNCNAGNFEGPPNKGEVLTPDSEFAGVDGSAVPFEGGESSVQYEGSATGSGDEGSEETASKTEAATSTTTATTAEAAVSSEEAVTTTPVAAIETAVQAVDAEATPTGRKPKGHGRGKCKANYKRSHKA
ncbi:lytic polysaccharide monooxygenase auxiliary activity family 9 protein [Aspergillus stella-maris]|uniref:lytic polysaccharide monooxygenase auxiliary activity family 9 protein n=1 Tax=Aspergillus stella-maris TaxID=1810926 RepID=UPI003CCD304F